MGQTKDDLYSRPPMERMLGIHEQLHASRFPNCTKLASQFEVTTRTIMRDIDFMKCRLNLPIEYDDARYGYYYSAPVEQFPGVSVSESELFALVAVRNVDPYQLACIDNRWYLFARDHARQEMRTFVLTRMTGPELAATGFQRPDGWSVQDHLKGSFGVFKDDTAADFKVEVEFDAWAADILRGRTWHHSQRVEELPSGQARMSFRLGNLEEIERWILSWGAHAIVIQPKQLVQRIRKGIQQLAQRYGKGVDQEN